MLTTVLIGLSIGMILVLIAAGLSLIFGMLGVANMAHGAFYMVGAFAAAETIRRTGSFVAALIVAPAVVAILGTMVEAVLLRPIYRRPHEQQFLLTFGLLLVLEEIARVIWGVDYLRVDIPPGLTGQMVVAGESLPIYRIFVTAAGLTVSVLLVLAIERTKVGMVLRAAMTHPLMTRALGIRVSRYRTLIFAFGGALAGLGGAIAAPLLPVQVNMGSTIILISFIVVIIGGIGNVLGAVLGAVFLGVLQALGQTYAADWVDTATYLLLSLLLLVRPEGLFSRSAGRRA